MTAIATKYPFVGNLETRQGGRAENQDNAGYVDTPLGLLLVVCDGMGGGPGGRTASLMAVEAILNVLSDVSEHTLREDALKYAIEKANENLLAKVNEVPELKGMGTTVVTMLINESSAVIAHVGDSRVYQLRKGTIVFRSADHSMVANLVRQKKLTEEEARNHPQSNIVTRALGVRPTVEVEFDEVPFLRGDRFVICTDGIWGMMPQRELVKSLSRVMGISDLTSLIIEEIDQIGQKNGGGHDNMTLAIIDVSFDSILKKIKRHTAIERPAESSVPTESTSKQKNRWKSWRILPMILVAFALLAASVYWICLDAEEPSVHLQSVVQGETFTTVGSRPKLATGGADSIGSSFSDSMSSPVVYQHEKNTNPFMDSELSEAIQKNEVSEQIRIIITHLETLKKTNGKNKKAIRQSKREYIKNQIVPAIKKLGNRIDKKTQIKEILELLDNKKTMSNSKTESNSHIEYIKTRVKDLAG